jgi:flagellar biosynthesis/type III secretory pathway protein FliH
MTHSPSRFCSALLAFVFFVSPVLQTAALAATPAPVAPKITSFSPASASAGDTISIGGSGFTGVTSVKFNGVSAVDVRIVSAASIKAVLPSGVSSGPILVTSPLGSASSPKSLEVLPPKITSVSPLSLGGGELFTINGVSLADVTSVTVNGKAVSAFKILSESKIQATMPIGASSGPVVVTSPEGVATGPKLIAVLLPKVTAVSPLSLGGGEPFTITGDSLTDVNSIKVNGKAVTQFKIASNGASIQAVMPAGASSGPVVVSSPEGTAQAPKPLTIIPPRIASFAPASLGGGDTLTITGVSLADVTSITVAGQAVASFKILSKTSVSAVMRAGSVSGTVVVVTPEGSAESAKSVTVVPPKVVSFSPAAVAASGKFTITGVSLSDVTAVSVNGRRVASFELVNSKTLRATLDPEATPGLVQVSSPEGVATSAKVLQVGPTISDYSPKEVDVLSKVQVDGLNFTRTGSTYIGRTKSTFAIDNDFRLSVTVPYSAVSGKVKVVSKDGLAALTGTDLKVWGAFPDASCTNTKLGYLDEYNEGLKSAKYIAAIDKETGTADGMAQGQIDGRAAGEALTADDGTADGAYVGYTLGYNSTYTNAYNQWYNTQYNASYTTGKNAGQSDSSSYSQGSTAGYNAGYSLGRSNGLVVAFNDGYDDGYPVGQSDGDKRGYADGVTEGERQGYNAGDSDGYADGRYDGYTPGYNAGSSSCYSSLTSSADGASSAVAPAAVAPAPTPSPAPSPACPVIGSLNGYAHNPIGIHSANDAENYCFQLGCSKVTSPYAKQYAAAYKPAYNSAYATAKAANVVYQNAYHAAYTYYYAQGQTDGTAAGKKAGITAGANKGYSDGFKAGAQIAYNNGYNDNYQRGYNAGYSSGYSSSTEYNRGWNSGHYDGYNNTYQAAYNEGVNDGYNDYRGYPDGYSDGYDDGYYYGYNEGYSDGEDSCTSYGALAQFAAPTGAKLRSKLGTIAKADRPALSTLKHVALEVPNPGIRKGALPAKSNAKAQQLAKMGIAIHQESMLKRGQKPEALPADLPRATAAAIAAGEVSLHQGLQRQMRALTPQLDAAALQAIDAQVQ